MLETPEAFNPSDVVEVHWTDRYAENGPPPHTTRCDVRIHRRSSEYLAAALRKRGMSNVHIREISEPE